MMITLLPACLNGFNLYAYFMCSAEKKKMIDAYINKGKKKAVSTGVNYATNNPDAFI